MIQYNAYLSSLVNVSHHWYGKSLLNSASEIISTFHQFLAKT